MNILISAYACEPNRGSEAEIGWGIVLELAKENQVWVITRANNRKVHDEEFARSGRPVGLKFIYYDLPDWTRFYKKRKRNFLIYYYFWQLGSYFAARQLIKEQDIDIVHHLTGGMDFFPSGMSLLSKPFVWGPVGGEDTHPVIKDSLNFDDRIKELKRLFLRFILRYLDPFVFLTAQRADLLLVYSSSSAKTSWQHLRRFKKKIKKGVQTGLLLDGRYDKRKSTYERHDPFTVVYAANLIHWKGGRFVAKAFAEFVKRGQVEARLVVVGEGPLLDKMKDVFVDEKISDHVEFLGFLPMQDLIDLLPSGDIFIYPTYHHGLANICLQAMVMGLPVICLEGDGIQTALDDGGGIVVPVEDFSKIPASLAEAMYELYSDENLRVVMAQNAQQTVINRFEYSVLASKYGDIYKETIQDHERRCTFDS